MCTVCEVVSARILPRGLLIVGHLDVVQLDGRAVTDVRRRITLTWCCGRGCGGYAEWRRRPRLWRGSRG
ncbi:hypothetical protein Aph02nite_14960 [Actinoplanes philippinensis]|nr:hypothetical protein Aph02nite_14960 [Actinoplanes philippinensis]